MIAEASESKPGNKGSGKLYFRSIFLPVASLLLALGGQWLLLYRSELASIAAILFIVAVNLFLIALYKWPAGALEPRKFYRPPWSWRLLIVSVEVRLALFLGSMILVMVSYPRFAGNYLAGGLLWWLGAVALFLLAFVQVPDLNLSQIGSAFSDWWQTIDKRVLVALLGIVLLATFFRFYRLQAVPLEMTSDHAEKILDVQDVLDGRRPIFFTRNTGREMFQFYLTAGLIRLTGLPNSHLTLKVGTALFGLFAVPFTYLLSSLLYGRLVGLSAAFFLAVSHWHVAITRVGLRFPFTAAFVTPVLYFLLRALIHNRRNDWLLAGLFLGIGLHTYTAMRVVPILCAALTGVTLVLDGIGRLQGRKPREGNSWSKEFWLNALLFITMTLLLLVPLLRYMADNPPGVWVRSMSRVVPDAGAAPFALADQFLLNVRNAFLMFNVRGDVVAMNTIPFEPVLGLVTGALFLLGSAYLIWRLFVNRDLRSLMVLIALFFLLLPSMLSLAYPGENPSVVRAGGAVPIVAIIAAVPLVALPARIQGSNGILGRATAGLMVLILAAAAIGFNYRWYFHDYDMNIQRSIANATELGAVLAEFEALDGDIANAYHVPYPHWVDTRAIGINAGHVRWENAVPDREALLSHVDGSRPRLYLLHRDDNVTQDMLRRLFPGGVMERYDSEHVGRDFFIFRVPAES